MVDFLKSVSHGTRNERLIRKTSEGEKIAHVSLVPNSTNAFSAASFHFRDIIAMLFATIDIRCAV